MNLGFVPGNDLGKDLVFWTVDTTIHLKLLEEWTAVFVEGVTFVWDVGVDVGGWRQATVKLVEFVRSLERRLEVWSDGCGSTQSCGGRQMVWWCIHNGRGQSSWRNLRRPGCTRLG